MTYREEIGKKIADIRYKRGLTTRQLAELCGITPNNINRIENGKYNVGIDILNKVCIILGAQMDIEIVSTLEGLRDYINAHDEWEVGANRIIELNGWHDDTGEQYGICNDGKRKLNFVFEDGELVADIMDM